MATDLLTEKSRVRGYSLWMVYMLTDFPQLKALCHAMFKQVASLCVVRFTQLFSWTCLLSGSRV
jgi:hypothetical protein